MKNNYYKKIFHNILPIWIALLLYTAVVSIIAIIFAPHYFVSSYNIMTKSLIILSFIVFQITRNFVPKRYDSILGFILVYSLLGLLYKETSFLNTIFISKIDPYLLSIDYKIFGYQPSLVFSEKFNTTAFSELMFFGYFSYYLLPLFTIFYLFINKSNYTNQLSFIVISSFLIYYILFIFLPAEGPQCYFSYPDNYIEAKGVFGKAVKYIQKIGEAPTAAFPSSHVGISAIILIFLYVNNYRKIAFALLPFVIILIFATIYIKAHYFVDIVFGLISSFIMFYMTNKFYNKVIINKQK